MPRIQKVMVSTALIINLFAFSASAQTKYPPFFNDPEVLKCAQEIAPVLVEGTNFTAADAISEAKKWNRAIPEMTKASTRSMAVMQVRLVTRVWVEGRQNMRPGFSFDLHETSQGISRICTYSVFEGLSWQRVLQGDF